MMKKGELSLDEKEQLMGRSVNRRYVTKTDWPEQDMLDIESN